jgi:hypothetical protein
MLEVDPKSPNCQGCTHDHNVDSICCGEHPEQCHACQEVRQNWALGFGVVLLIMLVIGLILS